MEVGGGRARSWYLSKEEIERGSPSRRDGVGAAKEAELRATYCSSCLRSQSRRQWCSAIGSTSTSPMPGTSGRLLQPFAYFLLRRLKTHLAHYNVSLLWHMKQCIGKTLMLLAESTRRSFLRSGRP